MQGEGGLLLLHPRDQIQMLQELGHPAARANGLRHLPGRLDVPDDPHDPVDEGDVGQDGGQVSLRLGDW